ncbi:unnamed protein product [Arctogadus glacialis]
MRADRRARPASSSAMPDGARLASGSRFASRAGEPPEVDARRDESERGGAQWGTFFLTAELFRPEASLRRYVFPCCRRRAPSRVPTNKSTAAQGPAGDASQEPPGEQGASAGLL